MSELTWDEIAVALLDRPATGGSPRRAPVGRTPSRCGASSSPASCCSTARSRAVRSRNLALDPRLVLHLEDGDAPLIVHARAAHRRARPPSTPVPSLPTRRSTPAPPTCSTCRGPPACPRCCCTSSSRCGRSPGTSTPSRAPTAAGAPPRLDDRRGSARPVVQRGVARAASGPGDAGQLDHPHHSVAVPGRRARAARASGRRRRRARPSARRPPARPRGSPPPTRRPGHRAPAGAPRRPSRPRRPAAPAAPPRPGRAGGPGCVPGPRPGGAAPTIVRDRSGPTPARCHSHDGICAQTAGSGTTYRPGGCPPARAGRGLAEPPDQRPPRVARLAAGDLLLEHRRDEGLPDQLAARDAPARVPPPGVARPRGCSGSNSSEVVSPAPSRSGNDVEQPRRPRHPTPGSGPTRRPRRRRGAGCRGRPASVPCARPRSPDPSGTSGRRPHAATGRASRGGRPGDLDSRPARRSRVGRERGPNRP